MSYHAFEQRIAGRELPAGKTLGNDELQKGAEQRGPKNGRAEITTGQTRRCEITGTDTGRGHQQARADDREQA